MSKLITFAGVSRVNGELKFRGANDVKRIDQLRKLGDTDVEMSFLNTAMTQQEAAQRLIDKNFANGRVEILELLTSVANKEVKVAKPKTVTIKVPTTFGVKVQGKKLEVEEVKMSAKEAAKIRAEFNARVKAAYEAN